LPAAHALLLGAREHLGREVDPHDARAGAREAQAHVAGAAAQVEHARAAHLAGLRQQRAPPALVDAQREHAVEQVVAPGDAREHRPNLARIAHASRMV